MTLPKEILDIISVYGGSHVAISLRSEYAKRILLKQITLRKAWMCRNKEVRKWLIKYNVRGFSWKTVEQCACENCIQTPFIVMRLLG